MRNALTILYILAFLAAGYAEDRWNNRPSARARWAALSLREKIARQVRRTRVAVVVQAGLLVLFPALGLAGVLPPGSWVTGVIVAGFYLAVNLYLLRLAHSCYPHDHEQETPMITYEDASTGNVFHFRIESGGLPCTVWKRAGPTNYDGPGERMFFIPIELDSREFQAQWITEDNAANFHRAEDCPGGTH